MTGDYFNIWHVAALSPYGHKMSLMYSSVVDTLELVGIALLFPFGRQSTVHVTLHRIKNRTFTSPESVSLNSINAVNVTNSLYFIELPLSVPLGGQNMTSQTINVFSWSPSLFRAGSRAGTDMPLRLPPREARECINHPGWRVRLTLPEGWSTTHESPF